MRTSRAPSHSTTGTSIRRSRSETQSVRVAGGDFRRPHLRCGYPGLGRRQLPASPRELPAALGRARASRRSVRPPRAIAGTHAAGSRPRGSAPSHSCCRPGAELSPGVVWWCGRPQAFTEAGATRTPPLKRRPPAGSPVVDGADLKEPSHLRGAEPLVAVAGVDVRAERTQIERDVSGRVRPVDDRERTGNPRRRAHLRHRQQPRGRRGDMADEDDARARPDRPGQRLRLPLDEGRSAAPQAFTSAPYSCARRQHLGAGLQRERTDRRVQARRRVACERKVSRTRADEPQGDAGSEPRPGALAVAGAGGRWARARAHAARPGSGRRPDAGMRRTRRGSDT